MRYFAHITGTVGVVMLTPFMTWVARVLGGLAQIDMTSAFAAAHDTMRLVGFVLLAVALATWADAALVDHWTTAKRQTEGVQP